MSANGCEGREGTAATWIHLRARRLRSDELEAMRHAIGYVGCEGDDDDDDDDDEDVASAVEEEEDEVEEVMVAEAVGEAVTSTCSKPRQVNAICGEITSMLGT